MGKVVIIGSGCAGLSAAIYVARAGLEPIVIEGASSGGQIISTSEVENFPAFPQGISGVSLIMSMREQAQKFGARLESYEVKNVDFSKKEKQIFCDTKTFTAEKVIVATGASAKLSGAKNEDILYGKGISVCATCDGAFYRNKNIAVIGGGDTACEEAIFLSKIANSVCLIHRRDSFKASQIMQDRLKANPKISLKLNCVVEEFLLSPNRKFAGIKLRNVQTNKVAEIELDGAFLAIGHTPNTSIFKGILDMDSEGYILSQSPSLVKTNVENVYVAGDCSDKRYRQAVVASAMGAMAAIECT